MGREKDITRQVVNLLKVILIIIMLLSGIVEANYTEKGFANWQLQQKEWIKTETSLSWPNISWAEARLGNEEWVDYEINLTLEPKTYGENGEIRLYFRQTSPFYTYSLNITETYISISRFDGDPTKSRELSKVDLGVKAGSKVKPVLRVFESEFSVFIDDKLVLEAESVKYKNGGISLWAENTSFSTCDFSIKGTLDDKYVKNTHYFPKEDPQSGGLKDLMLIYNNIGSVWTMIDALPYVSYIGPFDGSTIEVKDWFFDSFLFLALVGPGGHAFDAPSRGTPAKKAEWQWFIDTLFEEKRQLNGFERAFSFVAEQLGTQNKGKIYIMIPNPMVEITNFGDVDGTGSLNFSWQNAKKATDQRFRAVKWYVDQVLERFKAAEFVNLELVGFYWVEEAVHYSNPGEVELIKQVADYLHEKGQKFSWIPWFNASGNKEWESLGFDVCIHQPNHMFNQQSTVSRFVDVSQRAQKYNQGIEIEADGRILYNNEYRERFLNYLRAGVTLGYMKEAVHGYYQDVSLFATCALSSMPKDREIYDLVYKFVKEEFDEPLGALEKDFLKY